MAQTFDVRFARSAGLAGLFEEPANSFRWKGAGKLSIDAQGISIAVKRGLLTLFSKRSRRIAAGELTDVYREGDALRFEFGSDERREVLPVWATGNAAAAEIVKLLPTIRTVEFDHATRAPRSFRIDRRAVTWLVVIAALIIGALVLPRLVARTAAVAPEITRAPAAESVETAQPSTIPAADIPALPSIEQILSRDGIQPFRAGTVEHDIARRQQLIFEGELTTLRRQYEQLRALPNPASLEALEPSWWAVTYRIETSEQMSGPAFLGFREAQLAVISTWRAALSLHAAGLRLHDERFIEFAKQQCELAELYEQVVRMYVP